MSVLAKAYKIGNQLGAANGINAWEPKGPRVIIDVTLDRGNNDPTTQ